MAEIGKLIFFRGYCFFCHKPMVERGIILLPEDRERFHKVFGGYPNRFASTIGKEPICQDCAGDLRAMAQPEESD